MLTVLGNLTKSDLSLNAAKAVFRITSGAENKASKLDLIEREVTPPAIAEQNNSIPTSVSDTCIAAEIECGNIKILENLASWSPNVQECCVNKS